MSEQVNQNHSGRPHENTNDSTHQKKENFDEKQEEQGCSHTINKAMEDVVIAQSSLETTSDHHRHPTKSNDEISNNPEDMSLNDGKYN
jgi:hypothetical protein